MQPVAFSEVSRSLLSQAFRACKGLDLSDGVHIIQSIATRAAGLLRGFEVDDVDAQQQAEALAEVIAKREDIFTDEQREDVATALKESMDFKQLMDEAMVPLESLDADMLIETQHGWEESGFQDDSNCVTEPFVSEEVLDQLIATLREKCAEDEITV